LAVNFSHRIDLLKPIEERQVVTDTPDKGLEEVDMGIDEAGHDDHTGGVDALASSALSSSLLPSPMILPSLMRRLPFLMIMPRSVIGSTSHFDPDLHVQRSFLEYRV